MKHLSVYLLTLVSFSDTSTAFIVSPQHKSTSSSIVTLEATRSKRRLWKPIVSGGIMGWALATKIATASITSPDLVHHIEYFSTQEDYPTIVLAQGAYQPESSFESPDMGMPSYRIKADERFDKKLRPIEEVETPTNKKGAKKDKAREKIEKEQADMKKFVERQQALAEKKAAQERQKEKIAAERAAAKEAKEAERLAREDGKA